MIVYITVVSFSINFIYHDLSRKHLARTLHLTMIHKYSWHGTKLRDNKILHTYFITTWENDLSRCIAESANVHGLTFLSIVRYANIHCKILTAWLVKCKLPYAVPLWQRISNTWHSSRLLTLAKTCNGRTGGRSLIEKRLTAFLSRTYNAASTTCRESTLIGIFAIYNRYLTFAI